MVGGQAETWGIRGKWSGYALAFGVPVALLAGVFLAFGVKPFGPNGILFVDMGGQYVHFMAGLKDLVSQGLGYTWHKVLGGEALSLAAYYLFSPFNLLLFLVPASQLSLAVVALTLAKVGAAGAAMMAFLRRQRCGGALAVGLCCAWALSGYVMGFAQNLMWLDAVALLPLIVLGLQKLLAGGAPWLYLGCLTAGLFACYYTGWMLCLFCAVYFSAHWLAQCRRPGSLRVLGRFAAASLLAGGLQMWLLLPVVRALGQGKAQAAMEWGLTPNFSFRQLLAQFLPFAYPQSGQTNLLPLVYCGLLPLALAALFFAVRAGAWGKKAALAATGLVLAASLYFRTPDLIWHGFQAPTWFPYRYSFTLIFVVLECAALGGGWLGQKLARVRAGRWVAALLGAALCVELALNGADTLQKLGPTPDVVAQRVNTWQSAVEELQARPGFARMDVVQNAAECNLPFLLGYAGLSHYSSSYDQDVLSFMQSLGYPANSGWSVYGRGSTQAADSLLGLAWRLGGEARPGWQAEQAGGQAVYRNPYALGLGFACAAAPDVHLDRSWAAYNTNQIYSALLGEDAKPLVQAGVQGVELENLVQAADGSLQYTVQSAGQPAALRFTVVPVASGPLYASFPVAGQYCGGEVWRDGRQVGTVLEVGKNGLLYLGVAQAGQPVTVELRAVQGTLSMAEQQFWTEDLAALAQAAGRLQKGAVEFTETAPGHLKGTVQVAPGQTAVLFTLPYEEGWRVLLDGQPVQPQRAFEALLAVPAGAGSHTLELRYRPPLLAQGAALSLASLAGLALWAWARKKQKQRAS